MFVYSPADLIAIMNRIPRRQTMARALLFAACVLLPIPAWAADTINVYTAWPESL
jgi:hypothetical protein